MGLCEINLDGVAKRKIKADKYNMTINFAVAIKTVKHGTEIYNKFVNDLKNILSSEDSESTITTGALVVVRNKEEIKKRLFTSSTVDVAMLKSTLNIEIKNVNDIIGRITALCDQYTEKTNKDTSIMITNYGIWDFSDEYIDETKLDLMTEAYDNAKNKIDKLMKSGKIGTDSVHAISNKFKAAQIGEARFTSNDISRYTKNNCAFDGFGASTFDCEEADFGSLDDIKTDNNFEETIELPETDIPERLVTISIPMRFIEEC